MTTCWLHQVVRSSLHFCKKVYMQMTWQHSLLCLVELHILIYVNILMDLLRIYKASKYLRGWVWYKDCWWEWFVLAGWEGRWRNKRDERRGSREDWTEKSREMDKTQIRLSTKITVSAVKVIQPSSSQVVYRVNYLRVACVVGLGHSRARVAIINTYCVSRKSDSV